jgi:hypothetical protein
MTMDTIPTTDDGGALVAELEAQAARIGADIDACKTRIAALKRNQRIVLGAVSALKRGDGLQPGLPNGHDGGAVRPVTHGTAPLEGT